MKPGNNFIEAASSSANSHKVGELVNALCPSMSNSSVDNPKSSTSGSNKWNQIDAVGTLQYGTGDVYEGALRNGLPEGKGTMRFANGDSYVGNWRKRRMTDKNGSFTFFNGSEYRGGFGKSCKN